MSIYKEIHGFPFRDFTLKEFANWADVFSLNKKQNFLDMTFEHSTQIVYYHLAIENYEGAIRFLNYCTSTENQTIFLKSILNIDHSIPGDLKYIPNETFRNHIRDLFNLALINYVPAIIYISNLDPNYDRNIIDLDGPISKDNILYDLIKIKQNCASAQIDYYYLYKINKKIERIECYYSHSNSNQRRDWSILTTYELFKLIINGSENAMLIALSCQKRVNTYQTAEIKHKSTIISNKFLHKKVQDMDLPVIVEILKVFTGLYISQINELAIDNPLNLIEACLEQAYKYLTCGGNNAKLIIAYLEYFFKVNIRLAEHYESICGLILEECYKVGFVILPNMYYELRPNLYKRFPIESIENYVKTINNLVENFFWFKSDPSSTIIKHQIMCFYKLIDISPVLWKAACCVLGINLLARPDYVTDNILEKMLKIAPYLQYSQYLDYLIIPVKNMLEILNNLAIEYLNVFCEEVSQTKLKEIRQKIHDVDQKYREGTFEINHVIRVLLDICDFNQKYRNLLEIHYKYAPDGDAYCDIEADFYKIAKTSDKFL